MFTQADLFSHAVVNKVSLDMASIARLSDYLPLLNALSQQDIGPKLSIDAVLNAAIKNIAPSDLLCQECPAIYGYWIISCRFDLTNPVLTDYMVHKAESAYLGSYRSAEQMLHAFYKMYGQLPSGSTENPADLMDYQIDDEVDEAMERIFSWDHKHYFTSSPR